MKFIFIFCGLICCMFSPAFGQLRVHSTGLVTIGTTSPSNFDRLMIHGGSNRGLLITSAHSVDWWQSSASIVSRALTVSWVVKWNNQDRFWVQGNGTIVAKDAYFYSDVSLKENIRPIKSALERLNKIDGVSFSYKPEIPCEDCGAIVKNDSVAKEHFGFVAQDLQEVFPEVVSESPNKLLLVSYQQMIPVLVASIKEQQAEIEGLKKEVQWLRENSKVSKLSKKSSR